MALPAPHWPRAVSSILLTHKPLRHLQGAERVDDVVELGGIVEVLPIRGFYRQLPDQTASHREKEKVAKVLMIGLEDIDDRGHNGMGRTGAVEY
jgi:hypothetical protein